MILVENIFREYDIRGVVGKDFDAALAYCLGRAFVEELKLANPNKPVAELSVVVGYDCRLSGPELKNALMAGLLDAGVKVFGSGMGPTPQLYYAAFSKNRDGAIQVTGSHNPGDQNGFKMLIGHKTLSGPDIQKLKNHIKGFSAEIIAKADTPVSATPGAVTDADARAAYIAELVERSRSHMGERKLKIVVDAGNGVGGLVGPQVLRELGCEVIELFTEPDGRFPNHHPDPTVVENLKHLQDAVKAAKADLGIAWDGDADRIGVVDELAQPIFGDMLLVLYGRQLLKEVKQPTIIGDVKCSELMFTSLREQGANTVMAKTGHSLIKAKLKELNAELAGEMSGHMFFKHRYFGFDDALHASARLVELLSQTSKPLSALLSDLPKTVSTPEIRVDCPEEVKFKVAEAAQSSFPEYQVNTLDGVRVTFEHGWGLVRASNTQPVLVMRFEADSEERLAQYQHLVEERIERLKAECR